MFLKNLHPGYRIGLAGIAFVWLIKSTLDLDPAVATAASLIIAFIVIVCVERDYE